MNYIPIHTNITPNYNYLAAENAFLKQDIEYKNAVLSEQQHRIDDLKKDIDQLSSATATMKANQDQSISDAARWNYAKNMYFQKLGFESPNMLEKKIDKDIFTAVKRSLASGE